MVKRSASLVATDGDSKEVALGRRVGWGVFNGCGDARNAAGPVCGLDQTVPSAEAAAVTHSICRATGKAAIATDLSDVRHKVQWILDERKPWGEHQEAWKKVWQYRCYKQAAHRVKAHVGEEEAEARARTEGYLPQRHALNEGAGELAGIGFLQHAEDPGNDALRRSLKIQAIAYWRYFLNVYKLVRSHQQVQGCGLTGRIAKEGPAMQRTHGTALAEATHTHALWRNQCVRHIRAHIVQIETTSHAEAMA